MAYIAPRSLEELGRVTNLTCVFSIEMHGINELPKKGSTTKQYSGLGHLIFLGRLFWVDLIKWVSNVQLFVRPSVRPSVHNKFLHFSEISCIGRGRWVMHDGMQYDPIQGQGQGHEPVKVGNPSIFKFYLLLFTMGAGNWPLIVKLVHNI